MRLTLASSGVNGASLEALALDTTGSSPLGNRLNRWMITTSGATTVR